ncbi:MAG: hypothetical protein U0105_01080 [Candidatus Obscuribacterales bacterium]
MQKSLRKPRGADGKLVIIVVVVVLAVLILAGLGFYAYKSDQERQTAELKARQAQDLAKANELLQQRQQSREWAQQKRQQAMQWAEQTAAEKAEAEAQKAAYEAEFPPHRLQAVAKWTTWAPINLDTAGVEARLRSQWVDGGVNFRLALLGSEQAINAFCGWERFIIMFQDSDGVNMTPFSVSPKEFRWSDPAKNRGIPTLELEKKVPYPIQEYERAAQWNLMWSGE